MFLSINQVLLKLKSYPILMLSSKKSLFFFSFVKRKTIISILYLSTPNCYSVSFLFELAKK